MLAGVPLLGLVVGPLMGRLQGREAEYRERQSVLTARIGDLAGGLRVLNGLGGKGLVADAFRRDSRRLSEQGYRVGAVTSWIQALGAGLPTLFLAGVTWVGARLAVRGEISVGELVSVYGYVVALLWPVAFLIEGTQQISRGLVAAGRVVRFLRLEPEPDTGTRAAPRSRPSSTTPPPGTGAAGPPDRAGRRPAGRRRDGGRPPGPLRPFRRHLGRRTPGRGAPVRGTPPHPGRGRGGVPLRGPLREVLTPTPSRARGTAHPTPTHSTPNPTPGPRPQGREEPRTPPRPTAPETPPQAPDPRGAGNCATSHTPPAPAPAPPPTPNPASAPTPPPQPHRHPRRNPHPHPAHPQPPPAEEHALFSAALHTAAADDIVRGLPAGLDSPSTPRPATSPAASASASAWRGPCSPTPRYCSPWSRPRPWTRTRRPRWRTG